MAASLDYHEPDIQSILILASFLLVLNIGNYIIDALLSCGLVIQILIGIAWGTPGGKLLDAGSESVITALGYIGLILLVFEGGLSTSVEALRKNLLLSILVAITGTVLPIALSFVLISLTAASPLQCFAAGAALCSTSLGTTFTLLQSNGLANTRLGSVLTSAAMLDDVVGLIMVQVINNLNGTFQVASVLRPIGVSLAFAALSVGICLFGRWLGDLIRSSRHEPRLRGYRHSAFVEQTAFLIAMVTAASYAGTSNLFAAYLTGVCVSWWYTLPPSSNSKTNKKTTSEGVRADTENAAGADLRHGALTGASTKDLTTESNSSAGSMYERYYLVAVNTVLKPFFFASIGFAIPITQMFQGRVIWRGLIYALLMCVAKMLTGLWVINLGSMSRRCISYAAKILPLDRRKQQRPAQAIELSTFSDISNPKEVPDQMRSIPNQSLAVSERGRENEETIDTRSLSESLSILPAMILGMAMTARGEIGFLIAATAQSSGIFAEDPSQSLYLTVIWAIMLCTIIGPLVTGFLASRANKIGTDGLGRWGIS